MKEIQLTKRKIALVDDADYERLSQWKWCATCVRGLWYAVRTIWSKGKKVHIRMHREIMKALPGILVDHRDGDGLNNQRYNLRFASNADNLHNCGKYKTNTSGFKGVSFDKRDSKWRAKIKVDGRHIHLGYFDILEEAARAYNEAAIKYHGKFARLNEMP